MEQQRVDWPSFGLCAAILIFASIPLLAYPKESGEFLESLYSYISNDFGILYLLASVSAVGFLVWLASSRYGNIRLGDSGEQPEFGQLSWVGMLFCAGVGAGLLVWCATEWAYYYDAPPFGAEPRSTEAAEWASTYGLFHWGFTAWAFYCLPAVAIAYPYYTKKLDILRFSVSCHWFLEGREHGAIARSIDFLFMIALLGGAASSLGFSTPMIAATIAWLFNIDPSDTLEIAVVGICILLFAISVWLGLKKGIKRLSDIDVGLAFGLLLFILLVGPTAFLLKTSLNGLGVMAQNFLRMSFWTDPFTDSGFVESWTIFYWAWWIAFAPFVGLFLARISRGRTIREFVLGAMIAPSLMCFIWFAFVGGTAIELELSGEAGGAIIATSQESQLFATLRLMLSGPMLTAMTSMVVLLLLTYLVTSADSAVLIINTINSGGDESRKGRPHTIIWGVALTLVIGVLLLAGGMDALRSSMFVGALPFSLIMALMGISLLKALLEDRIR